MYIVRGSEMQDFLRCRLRWKYAWVDGFRPKTVNGKLFFGTLFHKFAEVFYSHLNACEVEVAKDHAVKTMLQLAQETDTSGMEQVEYDELMDLVTKVADNYVSQWGHMDEDNWEVIATELNFMIPITDMIAYEGTIDLIVRNKADGKVCFLDHKTTSSLEKYEKNSIMDRQISRYWWALQQLQKGHGFIKIDDEWMPVENTYLFECLAGAEIGGFIYNIILKDYPVPPKVLKKGGLSKDKGQKTTYELYMKAIEENELNPDDYQDILEYLKENGKAFFRRVEVYRNQDEINAAMREYYWTVKDMGTVKARLGLTNNAEEVCYRNITSDCHWDCDYKDVCVAGFDGSNVDYLLNTLYTKEDLQ